MSGMVYADEPQVSVVIPCFNQAQYLGEAIESVLAQDYPNIELVIIDDGSTDMTPAVTRQYASVQYVRQTNQGLSAARNAGIRASRGEYLVFLDADDWLLPGALTAGVRCMHAHPDSAFVSGGYCCMDETGRIVNKPAPARIDGDHYLSLLRGNYIGMHGTVMYQSKMLTAEGGFDSALSACEDYELYLRLARVHPVNCHDTVVANYRIHRSNMSADAAMMLPIVLHVLRSQRKYVEADHRRISAYHAGVRYWKDFYARRFVLKYLTNSGHEGHGRFPRGVLAMMRYAPREFLGTYYLLVVRPLLPTSLLVVAARLRGRSYCPPVGRIRFGDLRRTMPISTSFGYDRGLPIDRYYIEDFLTTHSAIIAGRILEIGDDSYTRRFGGDRVTRSDVLHVSEGNPQATFVGDLSGEHDLPSDSFDCAIVTQTLHLIYEVRPALQTLYRILKPGGVLLATVPGISQISGDEWAQSWYWSFTSLSMRRLAEEYFSPGSVEVEVYGNVLTATGFLQGIATGDLKPHELDFRDPRYEVVIAVKAIKPDS